MGLVDNEGGVALIRLGNGDEELGLRRIGSDNLDGGGSDLTWTSTARRLALAFLMVAVRWKRRQLGKRRRAKRKRGG